MKINKNLPASGRHITCTYGHRDSTTFHRQLSYDNKIVIKRFRMVIHAFRNLCKCRSAKPFAFLYSADLNMCVYSLQQEKVPPPKLGFQRSFNLSHSVEGFITETLATVNLHCIKNCTSLEHLT